MFSAHASWFFGVTSPTSALANFNDTCSVPPPITEEQEKTELDRLIAQDSVSTNNYDPETKQMAMAGLFDKLEKNEELRESEDYFSEFYRDNESTTLGMQSKVRSAMKQINIDVNNNETTIAVNDSMIHCFLVQKSVNDSLLLNDSLSEADSVSIVENNHNLTQNITSLIMQTSTLLKLFTDSQVNKVSYAKGLNDALTATTTLETNEQELNDVYLRNLALGIDTLSTTDLDILMNIALQCPFAGGRAVYIARAIRRMMGDTIVYNDSLACAESESRLSHNSKKENHFFIIVSPNPVSENCTFNYKLPEDRSGKIEIYNCLNEKVDELRVNSKSNQINYNSSYLKCGFYLFRLISDGENIGSGKIVVTK